MKKTSLLEQCANYPEEFSAAVAALDGNAHPLAEYVLQFGALNTELARQTVHDLLLNKPRQRGIKRTASQIKIDLNSWNDVRIDMEKYGITENAAVEKHLNEVDTKISKDTFRGRVKRGKKLWLKIKNPKV